MADRQKLIAVCLSQVHNFLNTGFLNELSRIGQAEGFGVVGIFTGTREKTRSPVPVSARSSTTCSTRLFLSVTAFMTMT